MHAFNCFGALVNSLFVFLVLLVYLLRLILLVELFVFPFKFFLFKLLGDIIMILFVPFVLEIWAFSCIVFCVWEL